MVVASQGGCGPWPPNMLHGWKVRDIARDIVDAGKIILLLCEILFSIKYTVVGAPVQRPAPGVLYLRPLWRVELVRTDDGLTRA